MNKKLNCINGLYLFNQFILSCYKFIDINLINCKRKDYIINKSRYINILSFNYNYINNMNIFYNINIK